MSYMLTIVNGRGLGTRFLLKGITTIGRERVDVLLDRDDTVISRAHAVIEVTPSENLVVFSDRSQHGSYVIRESGEKMHVRGRATDPGDPAGSVLLRERDQVQMGGITLMLERLTPEMLRDEDVPEEAAVMHAMGGSAMHGMSGAVPPPETHATPASGVGASASSQK